MAVDRSRLPALGAEPSFTFPAMQRHVLPTGLRVWTVEHHAVPLVNFLLLLPVGAAADPAGRQGLASMTGDMLDEGCGDMSMLDVHDALGRMGAHLEMDVAFDATLLTLTSLARFASRGAALLADMIARPRLDAPDFERIRELRLNHLAQTRDIPTVLARRAFAALLYPGHPYGHQVSGTEDSLRDMRLEDVVRFHADAYAPAGATMIAAGDASHAELVDIVAQAFAGWTTAGAGGSLGLERAMAPPTSRPERVALVHRPGAAQSELRIGHVAVPRSTPDYHALVVLNTILGGQFVSRINSNLRSDKGYTYGARTVFDFRRGPGPFILQASVQSEATGDAAREALSELHAIRGDRPATAAELEAARDAITRGYPRNFETVDHIARSASQLALYDLPDDYFTQFAPRVRAVDAEAVTRAAGLHIDPARLVTLVVGDREKVAPSLEKAGLGPALEMNAG